MKYCLTENEPGRTLHGGTDTVNEQYWETSVEQENNQVTFGITLKDGFDGFPGDVRVLATYRLSDENELFVEYRQSLIRIPFLIQPTMFILI